MTQCCVHCLHSLHAFLSSLLFDRQVLCPQTQTGSIVLPVDGGTVLMFYVRKCDRSSLSIYLYQTHNRVTILPTTFAFERKLHTASLHRRDYPGIFYLGIYAYIMHISKWNFILFLV